MDRLELKFSASLKNARLGTIAAAQISKAIYHQALSETLSAKNDNFQIKSEQFAADVEIVVGEACTNSVKHCSFPDPEKHYIIVLFTVDYGENKDIANPKSINGKGRDQGNSDKKDKMIITVKDQNDKFDFNSIPEPDFSQFPESGYGIFIIKEKMDQVTYHHHEGWNILTMTKYI